MRMPRVRGALLLLSAPVDLEVMVGTSGLRVDEVVHVLVPGGGRSRDGCRLSRIGSARASYAGLLFTSLNLSDRGGRLVCSGYKSPGDTSGAPWRTEDAPGEFFTGVPEADLMRTVAMAQGVDGKYIRVERRSIDTVTNLARSEAEGHFGDEGAVAIVSHRQHLHRIIRRIAPRTLRRRFLGVAVPESGLPYTEGPLPSLVSSIILLGLRPDSADLVERTDRRAAAVWAWVQRVSGIRPVPASYQSQDG